MTKIVDMKKFKVYYRVKCSMRQDALAQHVAYVHANPFDDSGSITILRHHINVFLPRMWRAYRHHNDNNERFAWDDLFSHAVSHEYIHKLLTQHEGAVASAGFDKIRGQYDSFEYNYIRTGLPLKEEK